MKFLAWLFAYNIYEPRQMDWRPGEHANAIHVLRNEAKTEAQFLRAMWSLRDKHQNERNRAVRARYALPYASGTWTPKVVGAVKAKPPLTKAAENNLLKLRKAQAD